MRKLIRHHCVWIVLTVPALFNCTGETTHYATQHNKEQEVIESSSYTEKAVLDLYASDPKRALVLIDSAELLGNVSSFRANLLRAQVYAYPSEVTDLDTAQVIAEALLEHDSLKTDVENRKSVLRLLIDIARIHLHYNDQERWATELAMLCREQGDLTEALRTESEIGIVLTHLGQREDGLSMIDNAIRQLDSQRHFEELDACVIAIKRKLTALSLLPSATLSDDSIPQEQPYAEIIALANHLIDKLNDYEQHPNDYADGSSRQPDTDEVPGYCSFYRAQAYAFIANAYASQSMKGNDKSEKEVAAEKAREYLSLFEQTPYGQTLNGRVAITGAQCILGDYDKMLATYDEIDSIADADTLHSEYVSELRNRAIAAAARGDHAGSQDYWHRYSSLSETINEQLQASEAHEHAARYQAQTLKLALQEEKTAREKAIHLSLIIGLAFSFTLAFMLYVLRQRRILKEKNRILARRIEEVLKPQKDPSKSPRQGRLSYPVDDSTEPLQDDDTAQPLPSLTGGVGGGSSPLPNRGWVGGEAVGSSSSLFLQLSQAIIDEHLFLDPSFDRQAAMDRFHLSKERIGTAFAQGSDYTSLSAFVTACRVEHAARLLLERPEMPVVQVATASGFSSVNHFGRSFKSAYGLSPTEFRRQRERM